MPKAETGSAKGRKSRKTPAKKAKSSITYVKNPEEKRRPGRPKGSLNKKTIERRQLHKRGRPKGSKNKK